MAEEENIEPDKCEDVVSLQNDLRRLKKRLKRVEKDTDCEFTVNAVNAFTDDLDNRLTAVENKPTGLCWGSTLLWYCALVFIWLSVIAVGYKLHEVVPWNVPVHEKHFSFDRLAAIDKEVNHLQRELRLAQYIQEDWQQRARDLLAVEQSRKDTVLQMWDGNTLHVDTSGGLMIKDCTFLSGEDSEALIEGE